MNINWLKPLDLYCERLGPDFWAEPFNAFSNIFMFLAGVAGFCLITKLSKKTEGHLKTKSQNLSMTTSYTNQNADPFNRNWLYLLSFAACLTGIGSFLFHTYANFLTLWGDILPIMFFMEVFLAFTLREIFKWKWWSTITALIAFFATGIALQLLLPKDLLNGSVTYIHGVLVLMLITRMLNYKSTLNSETAVEYTKLSSQYAIAFAVFMLSLVFRTIDHTACEAWPHGTHFVWHTLNGLLLFLLIRIAIQRFLRVKSSTLHQGV